MTIEAPVRPEDVHLQPADWVTLSIPGLIWGASFYLIAEGLDGFSPYLLTWVRIAFGSIVLWSLPATRRPMPRADVARLSLLGVVWMAVPLTLFPLAEERVSSSVTGMLNGANPIFTAFVAALIARSLPPARQIVGLGVGLLGVVLIALPTWSNGSSSAVGIVMILAALGCYGIALNVAGPIQRRLGSIPVISRALLMALVVTTPVGLASIGDSEFRWNSAIAVAVLGTFGTGVAYVAMASNAGRFGSTRASSTTYLIPGVSILLGVFLRGESIEALAIVGSVVAVAGAYLVNTSRRPEVRVARADGAACN